VYNNNFLNHNQIPFVSSLFPQEPTCRFYFLPLPSCYSCWKSTRKQSFQQISRWCFAFIHKKTAQVISTTQVSQASSFLFDLNCVFAITKKRRVRLRRMLFVLQTKRVFIMLNALILKEVSVRIFRHFWWLIWSWSIDCGWLIKDWFVAFHH